MPGPGWKAAVEATLRIAPGLALDHARQHRMRQLDQRPAIKVDHLPLPLAVQLCKTAGKAEAGIVDQQLDMFAMGGEVGHQPVGGARQAQVRSDRAGIAELGRQRVDPILAAGDEHQPLALGRQLPSEIDAQPGRSAGDQRDRIESFRRPLP